MKKQKKSHKKATALTNKELLQTKGGYRAPPRPAELTRSFRWDEIDIRLQSGGSDSLTSGITNSAGKKLTSLKRR